ncbi:hypothetical protein [Agrococcus sp. HG114]|uniref:hypothetical protein n=1 Tax=Agrococcus sp. HG114 TaxID=2969757 RepID=UPI00215B4592|nr:hypothetical protein [Agrococcus sp. HG114]MCR8669751.1 hypothetical protein [Agrococcus sp. HG114]
MEDPDVAIDARPLVPHAPFELVLREPVPDALERALAALRAEELLGIVWHDTTEARLGVLGGAVLTDATGLALRAIDQGFVPGLALGTIAARLSRALDAAVQLVPVSASGDALGEPATSVPAGFDPEAAIDERTAVLLQESTRVAALVRRPPDVVRARLPELALGAGGPVALVPAGERSIVVSEGPSFPQWTSDLRPVASLIERDDRVELLAWLKRPIGRRRGLAERLGPLEADWALAWGSRPIGIHPDDAREPWTPEALRRQEALRVRTPMAVPGEAAAELGLSPEACAALERLWHEDFPVVDATRVAEAIGAPPMLAELASGRVAASDLPAALVREPASVARTVAASMRLAARPTGAGPFARMERWWFERPRLSIAAGAAMLVIAAAVLVLVQLAPGEVGADERGPWLHYLSMALVAVNGVATIATGVLGLRDASEPGPDGD